MSNSKASDKRGGSSEQDAFERANSTQSHGVAEPGGKQNAAAAQMLK